MPVIPPHTLSLSDLATELFSQGKHVLIPDTCTLLDVVRGPLRDGGDKIMRLGIKMARNMAADTLSFVVVLPSVLSTEWDDNLPITRKDLNDKLQEHKRLSESLDQLYHLHTGASLGLKDVTAHGIDNILEQTCRTIMAGGYTIQQDTDVVNRAYNRVVQKRPPSRKGKTEMKDCTIFEEVLALGNTLATQSFGKSVVFCSTNKEEYSPGGRVLAEIASDLTAAKVEFAASLDHAVYLASI